MSEVTSSPPPQPDAVHSHNTTAPLAQEAYTMKKIVTVTEVEGEGLEALLGQNVVLICLNYIYAGKLEGVNTTCVMLSDAKIVYETGTWTDAKWKDAQSFPGVLYVQTRCIESFGAAK